MPTFIWTPTYGSRLSVKHTVDVLQFGDGYEQRVAKGLNTKRRKWSLSFDNRPNATADAIEAFLDERGALQSFDWTPPHGAPGKWVCREWDSAPTSQNTRSLTALFDEVFEI